MPDDTILLLETVYIFSFNMKLDQSPSNGLWVPMCFGPLSNFLWFSPFLTLLQPHLPPSGSWKMLAVHLHLGFCTDCFCTLECSSTELFAFLYPHLLWTFAEIAVFEWGLVVVVQTLGYVWLFATSWTAACQASLSFTISQSLLKLMSIESVMPSNHPIHCCFLLLLPSVFPNIRAISNESVLCIRCPKYWSFSLILSNEYSGLISFMIDWFNSLLSKRLSRVFSSTTVQKHQFFGIQLFYGPTLTSTHDYWKKTIAFTIWSFKVMSLLFIRCLGLS